MPFPSLKGRKEIRILILISSAPISFSIPVTGFIPHREYSASSCPLYPKAVPYLTGPSLFLAWTPSQAPGLPGPLRIIFTVDYNLPIPSLGPPFTSSEANSWHGTDDRNNRYSYCLYIFCLSSLSSQWLQLCLLLIVFSQLISTLMPTENNQRSTLSTFLYIFEPVRRPWIPQRTAQSFAGLSHHARKWKASPNDSC